MICAACKVEMNNATTEMEVSVKDRMVKVVHVPAVVCPQCNKLVVEELVDKLVRKVAKHCKGETLDYPKEIKAFGIGFGKASL